MDDISEKTFVNEASTLFRFRFPSGHTLTVRQTVRWAEFKGEGPAQIAVFDDVVESIDVDSEEKALVDEFLYAVAKALIDVRQTIEVSAGQTSSKSMPTTVSGDQFQVDVEYEPPVEGPARRDMLHYMSEGPEKVRAARALMGLDCLPN